MTFNQAEAQIDCLAGCQAIIGPRAYTRYFDEYMAAAIREGIPLDTLKWDRVTGSIREDFRLDAEAQWWRTDRTVPILVLRDPLSWAWQVCWGEGVTEWGGHEECGVCHRLCYLWMYLPYTKPICWWCLASGSLEGDGVDHEADRRDNRDP